MQWQKSLKYLGLGCGVALWVVLLGWGGFPLGVRQLAIQAAVPSQEILASPLPTLQLVQQGKKFYQSGRFAEAVEVWQQAAVALAQVGDRLNQAMVLSNLALAYQQWLFRT
jgi:hypothetical protein